MSLQVFIGIKATENMLEVAYNILVASLRIVIEWIFGCLNKMFPLLRPPEKLCLGNGNIGTTVAAATILYNAVSFLEPNIISQKSAWHQPGIQQFLHENYPRTHANTKAAMVLASLRRRTMIFQLRKRPRPALLGERWHAKTIPRL
jgi:hypothetical protein